MDNFRNLIVWKKAVDLATKIYLETKDFPIYELYGLTSQIRKSVVSISSNIAEGAGRRSKKEFSHFLNISYGSACELETQLLIARNLGFLQENNFNDLFNDLDEIQKMIYVLEKKLTTNL